MQSLSGASDNDFAVEDFSPIPSSTPSEDLSQFNTVATKRESTFLEADNLADLSWDEPDTSPLATSDPEQIRETDAEPQDTTFDFSSFSFDDVASSVGSNEKNRSTETADPSVTTIELSMNTETADAPAEIRFLPTEATPSPETKEHQENIPRSARPLRPRVRQQKKGSSRLTVKVSILILLALAATYGILNRDQIQNAYKNIVSSFIENQTRIETNGRIGLIKLSGSYVLNRQAGDLFVIRGEAINEFNGLRSSVLVRGTIYGDNGAVLKSQSAYCGNPLKDSSLKDLSFKEIRDIMSNELGENLVNLNIETGKGIPFTIVFNEIPKNIKEFTVEVLESKPGSK